MNLKKFLIANKNFEENYENIINELGKTDIYEDIPFPTELEIQKTMLAVKSEIKENKTRFKKEKFIHYTISAALILVLLGEIYVLKTVAFKDINTDKSPAAVAPKDKEDKPTANDDDSFIPNILVEPLLKQLGYTKRIDSGAYFDINLPFSFNSSDSNEQIASILQSANKQSKEKFNMDFSIGLGQKICIYTCNIEKDNKTMGNLNVLILKQKVIGVWIDTKDKDQDFNILLKLKVHSNNEKNPSD